MMDAAAESPMQRETELTTSPSLQDRYILTQAGDQQFAFPSVYVAEILLIERSQILALPFYDATILGVVHNHGRIVPLVEIQRLFKKTAGLMRETVNVVQLSQEMGHLAGIGIVIDQILDNRSRGQLPDEVLGVAASDLSGVVSSPAQGAIQLFRPELLSDRLWTPQSWH
jgi:chemotaxis signal transduction protein